MRLPAIEFDPVWVRRAGYGWFAVALLLPFTVMLFRAAFPPDYAVAQLRPEMVVIPGGSFLMGSADTELEREPDEQQHSVEITRPFAISRTEVTQSQYAAVTGLVVDDHCSNELAAGIGDMFPVVCVSWLDAVKYANRLSSIQNIEPAYEIKGSEVVWHPNKSGYRLPTEAEWEYAARAGTGNTYVGTDQQSDVCLFANVADQSFKGAVEGFSVFECDDNHAFLAAVENRKFNAWQLYGFGGNAAEWVWDWYADFTADSQLDPTGPVKGEGRVIRGGSFGFSPRLARVADRGGDGPGLRGGDVGFRLARSCPSSLLPSDTLPASQCFATASAVPETLSE